MVDNFDRGHRTETLLTFAETPGVKKKLGEVGCTQDGRARHLVLCTALLGGIDHC